MKELHLVSDTLFVDFSHEYTLARKLWDAICTDPTFAYKVRTVQQNKWHVPTWYGLLGTSYLVEKKIDDYSVLSVDGSQIYPDKHQGTSAFLINIGTVELHYGKQNKAHPIYLNSQPYILTPEQDNEIFEMFSSAVDLVNCRRQEFELREGLVRSELFIKKNKNKKKLFLIDGSIIFWHLNSKDTEIKHMFLSCYLTLMHQLYELNMPFAGYISLPKSKDIVNLLRVALADLNYFPEKEENELNHIVDTTLAHFYLKPYHRSTIFQSHSPINEHYPDHLKPHFFYVHVGTEIGRVEIPGWVAQNEQWVDEIASIILDQSIKGRGYPVCIAESHEQAVVKGPDRDFFYQLILKASYEQKRHVTMSAKSIKKRGIGI